MDPAPIPQYLVPLWLLRGFARGDGEAGETTWCYTADGVRATKLAAAGAEMDGTIGASLTGALAERRA